MERTLWTLHLVAGLIIVIFLTSHMVVMHLGPILGAPHPLSFHAVKARASSPLMSWGYVLLLAAALYHGLYGLKNIIAETGISPGASKALGVAFFLVGVVLFAYGARVTLLFAAAG